MKKFTTFLLTFLLFTFLNLPVYAALPLAGYDFRQAITIDSDANITADETAPVPVNMDSSETGFWADAPVSDGCEVTFTSSNGTTELPFDVESYDPTGDDAHWRIETPLEGTTGDTVIYIYYGATTPADNCSTSTWDANYYGSYYMNTDNPNATGSREDQTSNSNNGTENGSLPTDVAGQIDRAQTFDGTGDQFEISDIEMDSWTDLTVDAWFKTSDTANDQRIWSKDQVGVAGNFLLWFDNTGDWKWQVRDDTLGNWQIATYNSTAENDGAWHHIAGVVNNSTNQIILYMDGVSVATDDFTDATLSDGDNEILVIGADSDTTTPDIEFIGDLDDLSISDNARSVSWVEAREAGGIGTWITIGSKEFANAPYWDTNYSNRAEITVINNTASAVNSKPVLVMLDAYRVSASSIQLDGDDVRIIYFDGFTNTDIDRVFSYRTTYFKIQASISANTRTDGTYWIYWQNPSATSPANDASNVFDDVDLFTSMGFANDVSNHTDGNTIGAWLLDDQADPSDDSSTNNEGLDWTAATPTYVDDNFSGKTIDLDGSTEYGVITRVAGNSINQVDHSFDAWIKPDTCTNTDGIFSQDNGGAGTNRSLLYFDSAAPCALRTIIGGVVSTTDDNIIKVGEWQEIGYSYDYVSGTDCTFIFYVNGSAVLNVPRSSGCMESGTGDYFIGALRTGSGTFDGLIHDIHLSDSTRPASYFKDRAGGTSNYFVNCDDGNTVSGSGTLQISVSSTIGEKCTASKLIDYTTDPRRATIRFKTDADAEIRIGFSRLPGDHTRWGNWLEIEGTGAKAYHVGVTDSLGGTLQTMTTQEPSENWANDEWYSIAYDMTDYAIVYRIYKESTGVLVESGAWGEEAQLTGNYWLNKNLYFSIQAESNGSVANIQFDDLGIGTRTIPDTMPLYFSECTALSERNYFYETDGGDLYSAVSGEIKLYKSTDDCATLDTLIEDFGDGTYSTLIDNYSSQGFTPSIEDDSSTTANSTWTISTAVVQHRYHSMLFTSTDSGTPTSHYYQLGDDSTLNGYVVSTQYTQCAYVYVPSGMATLGNVFLRVVDDGATDSDSGNPSSTDTWEELCVTHTVGGSSTNVKIRLFIDQAVTSGNIIYWDNIRRNTGATINSTVFFSESPFSGGTAPQNDSRFMVFELNGRVFISFSGAKALLYTDNIDGSPPTWVESDIPWAATTDTAILRAYINHWAITSDENDNIYIGQHNALVGGGENEAARFFRSTDSGANFTEIYNADGVLEGQHHTHTLKFNPFNNTMYFSVGDTYLNVYYDTGYTDSPPITVTEISGGAGHGMAFQEGRVIVGDDECSGNEIKVTDDNINWITKWQGGGSYDMTSRDLVFHERSGIIFVSLGAINQAACYDNKIWTTMVSFDAGENWQPFYESEVDIGGSANAIAWMSYPPDTSNRVYFGVQSSVPNLDYGLYFVVDQVSNPMRKRWEYIPFMGGGL